jgi:hypothetical protein
LFGVNAGTNNTQDDIIAEGQNALALGANDPKLAGTIAIGGQALQALAGPTNSALANAGMVVIGRKAANAATVGDSCVIIGDLALQLYQGSAVTSGPNRCVVIGNEAAGAMTGVGQFDGNVVIGFRAMRGAAGQTAVNCVVIGSQAANQSTALLSGDVFIGTGVAPIAGQGGAACTQNVVIGQGAGAFLDAGDQNVILGQSAGVTHASTQSGNVVVGTAANAYGSNNVVIGQSAANGVSGAAGTGSIMVGFGAGGTVPNGLSDLLYIGTFNANGGGTENCVIYGRMDNGNLVLGRSTQGVDRDFRGTNQPTNVVKIVNGTVGTGTNPSGGGFLYASGGALHWFGSAGTDTVIAPA